MKIIFLGTAGYHPSNTRQTTCVMIPEFGIVLDAGTGFFRVRDHLKTDYLNVFLSHAHQDHSIGLTYLLDVLYQKFSHENVSVFGLDVHLERIKNKLFDENIFPILPRNKFIALNRDPESFSVNNVKAEYRINIHPGDSLGYRLTFPDGKVLVYVTDTTSSDADSDFAKGADLLIHECNFSDENKDLAIKTGHSWTSAVNSLAKKAGAKRLVLMHFNPLDSRKDPSDQENAKIKFSDPIIAYDGLELRA